MGRAPNENRFADRKRRFLLDQFDDRLFHIGCKGRSVDFHSQQKRALNLARVFNEMADKRCHLDNKGACPDCKDAGCFSRENSEIAIVGGGISGVSLWIFLRLLGFEKVTLFESGSELLHEQKNATHRHAHPSYNDWPDPDNEFKSSTEFPVFNWFADTAAGVVRHLSNDKVLKKCKDEDKERSNALRENAPVIELVFTEATKKIKMAGLHKNSLGEYDAVVLATGLGVGKPQQRYWADNDMDHFKQQWPLYREKHFIIQGNGDGGTADFVRLCLTAKAAEKNFAVALISYLRDKKYRSLSDFSERKAGDCFETNFAKTLSEGDPTQFDYEGIWGHFDGDVPGFFCEAEEDEKENFSKLLPQDKSETFRLKDELTNVKLLRKAEQHLYNSKAAPINNLAVALIKLRGVVPERNFITDCPATIKDDDKIIFTHTGVDQNYGKIAFKVHNSGPLGERPSPKESNPDILDWDDMSDFRGKIIEGAHGLLGGAEKYLLYLHKNIDAYINRYFEGAKFRLAINDEREPSKVIIHYDAEKHDKPEVFEQLGGFDTRLYGIPIEYRLKSEAKKRTIGRWG